MLFFFKTSLKLEKPPQIKNKPKQMLNNTRAIWRLNSASTKVRAAAISCHQTPNKPLQSDISNTPGQRSYPGPDRYITTGTLSLWKNKTRQKKFTGEPKRREGRGEGGVPLWSCAQRCAFSDIDAGVVCKRSTCQVQAGWNLWVSLSLISTCCVLVLSCGYFLTAPPSPTQPLPAPPHTP